MITLVELYSTTGEAGTVKWGKSDQRNTFIFLFPLLQPGYMFSSVVFAAVSPLKFNFIFE